MIEFEDVGFGYGGGFVLRRMTLMIEPGTLTVIVGASGSGKTTFLRLCSLDLLPSEGRIRLFGEPAPRHNRDQVARIRRSLGVVPQTERFIDHLSIIDNVALPLRAAGTSRAEREADLQALLEWVDLNGRSDHRPAALTRGERQRAALARALLLSPEVILADEPVVAVDRDSAERVLGLLVDVHRMGRTVLVATEDTDVARRLAGAGARSLILGDGRVVDVEIAA